MAKLIKVSETKAYRIEGLEIGGENYLSIRQMYKTKTMDKFAPAKQGLTLPHDISVEVLRKALRVAKDEELTFTKLEPRGKAKDKAEPKSKPKAKTKKVKK